MYPEIRFNWLIYSAEVGGDVLRLDVAAVQLQADVSPAPPLRSFRPEGRADKNRGIQNKEQRCRWRQYGGALEQNREELGQKAA